MIVAGVGRTSDERKLRSGRLSIAVPRRVHCSASYLNDKDTHARIEALTPSDEYLWPRRLHRVCSVRSQVPGGRVPSFPVHWTFRHGLERVP
jgi:hypothetical protein